MYKGSESEATTGEPALLKQTAWPEEPVETENLKSQSPKAPLLGFGKVLPPTPTPQVISVAM